MHSVSAKFVPRLLTEKKEKRVIISQGMLANTDADKIFLNNIITGDEIWVYGYDAETKNASQCVGKKSP